MKKTISKKLTAILIALVMAFAMISVVACDNDEPGNQDVAVTSVSVSPTVFELTLGATTVTQQLTATVLPSNATNSAVVWSSSDIQVATVNASGLVTAVGAGDAEITVTTVSGNRTAMSAVTVHAAPPDPIPLTGLAITGNPAAPVDIGFQAQLTAVPTPSNADNFTGFTWSSDNINAVTVTQNGNIAAVGQGSAVISVAADGTDISAQITVTVNEPVQLQLEANFSEVLGLIGDSITDGGVTLTARINDSPATPVWASSDSDVVTVNAAGELTFTGEGMATVTGSVEGNTLPAVVTVVVRDAGAVATTVVRTPVQLQAVTTTGNFALGNDIDLTGVEFTPIANTAYTNANGGFAGTFDGNGFTISNIDIDSERWINLGSTFQQRVGLFGIVSHDGVVRNFALIGGTIRGRGFHTGAIAGELYGNDAEGNRYRVATIENVFTQVNVIGSQNASGIVGLSRGIVRNSVSNSTVTTTSGTYTPRGGVSAFSGSVRTQEISHTFANSDLTGTAQSFNPTPGSDLRLDHLRASLLTSGMRTETLLRTAATFTAYDTDIWLIREGHLPALKRPSNSANGNGPGEIAVQSVTVSPDAGALTLVGNITQQLTAVVLPADATNRALTWSSADTSIATVDQNGLVTVLAPGTVVITAAAANGEAGTSTITVLQTERLLLTYFNHSFEDSYAPWLHNAVRTDEIARTGNYSIRLNAGGAMWPGFGFGALPSMPVVGEHYQAGIWFYAEAGVTGMVYMELRQKDWGGNYQIEIIARASFNITAADTGRWIFLVTSVSDIVLADADYMQFVINNGTNGNVFFDDFEMHRVIL